MGLLRKIADVATRTDPLASWGERAVYLVLFLFGPSTISALVLGGLSWLASNFVYGALVGLVAFVLTQVGLTLVAIRRSTAARGPFAEPLSEATVTPSLSPAASDELTQLNAKIIKAERERDSLKAVNEQLRQENSELRTAADSLQAAFHEERRERDEACHNRAALIITLHELWEEGDKLQRNNYLDYDLKDWQDRVSKLIEMALGVGERRSFLRPNPEYAKWSDDVDEGDPEEQIYMRCLLDRLKDVTWRVNTYHPRHDVRENFDIREYRKWLKTR